MKLITLMMVALGCHGLWAQDKNGEAEIPESMFPRAGGPVAEGEPIVLDPKSGEKLCYRYCSISDSGVEVDRVSKDGEIIWRNYVAALGVEHSKYRHNVWVRIEKDGKIQVTSVGARTIIETIDPVTGKQISRSVVETKR